MTGFDKASFGLAMLPAPTSLCFLVCIVFGRLSSIQLQTWKRQRLGAGLLAAREL